ADMSGSGFVAGSRDGSTSRMRPGGKRPPRHARWSVSEVTRDRNGDLSPSPVTCRALSLRQSIEPLAKQRGKRDRQLDCSWTEERAERATDQTAAGRRPVWVPMPIVGEREATLSLNQC